jgi:hypothetical protein
MDTAGCARASKSARNQKRASGSFPRVRSLVLGPIDSQRLGFLLTPTKLESHSDVERKIPPAGGNHALRNHVRIRSLRAASFWPHHGPSTATGRTGQKSTRGSASAFAGTSDAAASAADAAASAADAAATAAAGAPDAAASAAAAGTPIATADPAAASNRAAPRSATEPTSPSAAPSADSGAGPSAASGRAAASSWSARYRTLGPAAATTCRIISGSCATGLRTAATKRQRTQPSRPARRPP